MTVTYTQMVSTLVKSGMEILNSATPSGMNLVHMTMGISGEARELLDAVKKSVIYEKPLDRANVIEELGDLEFYMEGMRQELGISRDDCLKANMEKLSVRYQGMRYSNYAAHERADKIIKS